MADESLLDVCPLRDGVTNRLKENAAITATLGAGKVWGEKQPAEADWPFIRYGRPIITPTEASGWTGGRHRVSLHVFARGPSMDACVALMGLVVAELDGQEIDLTFPDGVDREATAYEIFHAGSQVLPDGDDWHGVVEFDTTTAGA